MSITAMKQALEALGRCTKYEQRDYDAMDALRAAIAEQEKCEPVAWRIEVDKYDNQWFTDDLDEACDTLTNDNAIAIPLYEHPAPVEKCAHVPVTTFGGDYCIKCDAPVESNNYPVPAGMVLVPVEPTDEMYMSLLDVKEVEDAREDMRNLWAAMLQAAPKPGEMK